uniref:Uncharacterized protein n=1 Tax=Arundo donax TaxID=35708 RepID=A0A0A9G6D6_ARUDO
MTTGESKKEPRHTKSTRKSEPRFTIVNHREEAGTAAAAARTGDARSLHAVLLASTPNSQRFQEKRTGLI